MASALARHQKRLDPFNPRSRGCGPRQRILSCCHSLIPGLGNTHRVTDKQMIVLDTMDLEARDMVPRAVHEHHRRKEGKHYGSRGRGRQTFVAQFIGLCSRSKWSKHRTKSPFLALLAMAGSNAAYKIISACSNAVS